MKQAVFVGKQRMEIKEVPVPDIAPDEVLLKTLGCGVCGTDAHIYEGEIKDAVPPAVIGHELMGEVALLGSDVTGLEVGMPVVVDPFVFCGHCDFCKQGEFRFCLNERFIGYHRTGGFSQYTPVPFPNVYKVPDGMTFNQAMLVETLATVMAGVSLFQPQAGKSCLILGAGTVGLLWSQVMKNLLSVNVLQTEIVPERLAIAEKLGADRVLSPEKNNLEKAVYDICPHGVDYIIDATGSTDAVAQALPLIKRGGTLMAFGVCPEDERLSLSLYWLFKKQIKIMASRRPPREMERAIHVIHKGFIDADTIVTGVFPLEQIAHTFRMFSESRDKQVKMAIDPWMDNAA
jgi:2-desacetyl-2-hydroxyethyl bacteriochlorophyllide A dehydrogenase